MAHLNKFTLLSLCMLNMSCLVMLQQTNPPSISSIIWALSNGTNSILAGELISEFLAALSYIPSLPYGERTEFKATALNDHVNDASVLSNAQMMIEQAGFKVVRHTLTSSDGYITELLNIINPLADSSQLKKPPVVFFHGALIDSTSFVWGSIRQHHPEKYPRSYEEDGPITSSNRSIALVLCNNGFNVWVVATRASNKDNIGHVKYNTEYLEDLLTGLNPSDAQKLTDTLKYLDYTQDALVEIEFPEQINEVCRLTGSDKVSVVTYSKGCQVMFKVLATDNDASNRIHSHVAIAPPLNEIGSSALFKTLSNLIVRTPNDIGNLVFTQVITSQPTRSLISSQDRYTVGYYYTVALTGPSPRFQTFLESPVIDHVLMPVGFTEFKQLCQQLIAGRLQKYDYGPFTNRRVYNGSLTPPQYNISSIKLDRWMMVSGKTDVLGTASSAQQYYDLIPNKPQRWIKLDHWNHLDVTAAFENGDKVNLPIMEFMENSRLG